MAKKKGQSKGQTKPKGKPGRPKGKPLSEAELAQRRGAAWKTGQHAESSLGSLPPCKPSLCPLGEDGFPCDLRDKRTEQGKPTERCAPQLLVDPQMHAAFLRARETGDPGELSPIYALLMASMTQLSMMELQNLSKEGGFSITEEYLSKDGDVLTKSVENPRGRGALKLLEMVGATADQQGLTPKSRSQANRDDSVADLFTFLGSTRKALNDGDQSD